jgi:hypothetical protein
VEARNREAGSLAALRAECASLAAKGRQVETEAAPMRCVAELVSADTDSERAIRWLIALLVYAATRLPSHCRRPAVARSTFDCCRADAIGRHSALGAKEALPPLRMLRKRRNVQPTGAPFQNHGA